MAKRILDGILSGTDSYLGNEIDAAHGNLIYGGQFGHHHRVGMIGDDGRPYGEYLSSAGYIRQNLIPFLLDYPKGFDYFPNPDLMIATLKTLIEVRSKTIEGFNAKLTVNTAEQQIGRAGSETIEDVLRVTREKSSVTHTIPETIGMGVNRFLDSYIRYLILDPDIGKPLVNNLMDESEIPGAWTPDYYTFTACYVEPDIQHYNCINAWLLLGAFPKGTGEWTGKRDIQSDPEGNPEHSIEIAGLVLPPLAGVRELGQKLLRGLTILRKMPEKTMHIPENEIAPKITDFDYGFNREW